MSWTTARIGKYYARAHDSQYDIINEETDYPSLFITVEVSNLETEAKKLVEVPFLDLHKMEGGKVVYEGSDLCRWLFNALKAKNVPIEGYFYIKAGQARLYLSTPLCDPNIALTTLPKRHEVNSFEDLAWAGMYNFSFNSKP